MATEETKMKKQDLKFNKNEDTMKLKLSALQRKIDKIHLGGGAKKVKKHHSKGKLTARERIEFLLDKDSDYVEMGEFAGYGMYEQYG
jgi:3-methylcrotonyl-CoA carboxylase beta subunit